jgi:hypothetical protein
MILRDQQEPPLDEPPQGRPCLKTFRLEQGAVVKATAVDREPERCTKAALGNIRPFWSGR